MVCMGAGGEQAGTEMVGLGEILGTLGKAGVTQEQGCMCDNQSR